MSITKTKKQINQDPIPIPENNPFVDKNYLGDLESLKGQIMERFDMYQRPRLIWDAMIYESVAFYAGYQNLYWNGAGASGSLAVSLPQDPTSTQAISNRIIGKCAGMINRLCSFDPTAQALPASPSTGDVYAARASKKIIQSNHYSCGFKAIYQKFAEFVVIEGDGWLKTQFDCYAGRKTVTYKVEPTFQDIEMEATQENQSFMDELGEWEDQPMNEVDENGGFEKGSSVANNYNAPEGGAGIPQDEGGQQNQESAQGGEDGGPSNQPAIPQTKKYRVPITDESGQPQMQQVTDEEGNPQIDKVDFDGSVRKDAIGPMNMFYSPTIVQWGDAFDCVEVQYLSIDQVKNMYPSCSDLGPKDYETNNFNPWVQVFKTVIERNPYGTQWGIPVYEYHCKSCPDFPFGLRVVIIKDKIRDGGREKTFNGEELPYDHAGFDPIPGAFRHLSLPMKLKNPQKIYNRLLSQYIDNARMFEVGKVIAPAGTKFTDKITNGNQIIYYGNTSQAPVFLNPSALSPAHERLLERMDNDIDTLSGINKTAEGNPPPSITSAEMSEAVTENDYQATQSVVENFMLAISRSCNKELKLMKDQGPDEILVRFFGGPGGKNYVNKFKKAVLRNLPDVWIIPGKSSNQSRGQQRKDIEMMLPIVTQQAGTPDQQKIIISRALDMMMWGDEEELVSYVTKQQNCILDKLAVLDNSANMPDFSIKIMPWYDMKVWMDVIETELLNEVEFDRRPDVVKNRLITLYTQVTNEQTNREMQAAMKMQGGPPMGGPQAGPGGPGVPGAPAGLEVGKKAQALQTQEQGRVPNGAEG